MFENRRKRYQKAGRMDQIVQDMSHPTTQYPSLVYFLGNGNRVPALRSLFPQNNITRRGPAGLARLHLSTTTTSTEHPIWIAESGFHDSTAGHVDIRTRSRPSRRGSPSVLLRMDGPIRCGRMTKARERTLSHSILPPTCGPDQIAGEK